MSKSLKKFLVFTSTSLPAFGLAVALTACDGGDSSPVILDPDSNGHASPDSSVSPSGDTSQISNSYKLSEINGVYCDSMTEGRYLNEYYCVGYTEKYRYYKCENGDWDYLSSEKAPVADSLMLHTYFWNNSCKLTRYTYESESSNFQECNDESEGRVDSIVVGVLQLGRFQYYRCEKGQWVLRNWGVTCDTVGVKEGSICMKTKSTVSYPNTLDTSYFVYIGDGNWSALEDVAATSKECSAENEGAVEKFGTDSLLMYYKCSGHVWRKVSLIDYKCAAEKKSVGDTCSIEMDGEMLYYLYVYNDSLKTNVWEQAKRDSVLGLCPISGDASMQIFSQSGEDSYYCRFGKWQPAKLIPQQYTDPRKEGLTDEEYDVLDLPKDASAGDRVGGLLEDCWNDETYIQYYGGYYFCLSKNYYRYKNGSWVLETEADRENDSQFDAVGTRCSKDELGSVAEVPPSPRLPGVSYQCVEMRRCRNDDTVPKEAVCPGGDAGTLVYVNNKTGYTFGRSEKRQFNL